LLFGKLRWASSRSWGRLVLDDGGVDPDGLDGLGDREDLTVPVEDGPGRSIDLDGSGRLVLHLLELLVVVDDLDAVEADDEAEEDEAEEEHAGRGAAARRLIHDDPRERR